MISKKQILLGFVLIAGNFIAAVSAGAAASESEIDYSRVREMPLITRACNDFPISSSSGSSEQVAPRPPTPELYEDPADIILQMLIDAAAEIKPEELEPLDWPLLNAIKVAPVAARPVASPLVEAAAQQDGLQHEIEERMAEREKRQALIEETYRADPIVCEVLAFELEHPLSFRQVRSLREELLSEYRVSKETYEVVEKAIKQRPDWREYVKDVARIHQIADPRYLYV
ncbi:MAG: hypothetical protein LBM19_00900 [Holosporales bacterium]|jgi:hypothetical protein|nr:hypothetical protein [Holosporales bacterium]